MAQFHVAEAFDRGRGADDRLCRWSSGLALGRGDKPSLEVQAPRFTGIQVRLATADEMGQLAEHRAEEEEMEMIIFLVEMVMIS